MDLVAERNVPPGPPLAPALPEDAPLAMPVQSLGEVPKDRRALPSSLFARRAFVIGGAGLLTVFAAYEMYLVLSVGGLTALESVVLALFVILFAWIGFSFTNAMGGVFAMVGRRGTPLGIDTSAPLPALSQRTAMLMPTYNESPTRVFAGLQATYESIQQTGAIEAFDFFILSDTTDADVWIAEEASFLALRERTGGHSRIFYRRRPRNIDRKAGNVGEWVTRFGTRYEAMLVLDADSVMTGDCVVRIAGAMEQNPNVGLIQTLPVIVGGRTLFARLQQFAGRLYGPLLAQGLAWWHGSESN
ncbi:MAG TPA: glucans biosynthesis glucosyltransferase MdoH, partial [Ancylobacter sp.]